MTLFAMTILNITICQSHDFCDYNVMLSKPCQVVILYFFLVLVDGNNNSKCSVYMTMFAVMTGLHNKHWPAGPPAICSRRASSGQ